MKRSVIPVCGIFLGLRPPFYCVADTRLLKSQSITSINRHEIKVQASFQTRVFCGIEKTKKILFVSTVAGAGPLHLHPRFHLDTFVLWTIDKAWIFYCQLLVVLFLYMDCSFATYVRYLSTDHDHHGRCVDRFVSVPEMVDWCHLILDTSRICSCVLPYGMFSSVPFSSRRDLDQISDDWQTRVRVDSSDIARPLTVLAITDRISA